MVSYVNHHAMREVFAPLESQPDAVRRAEMMRTVQDEFAENVLTVYERTAFELKEQGWSLEQIGDELQIAVQRVKQLVRDYAKRTNRVPPLRDKSGLASVVDIRSVVRRADRRRSGTTSHPTA